MIGFDEKNKVFFLLDTENTTYAIAIVDDRYVEHLWYGAKIEGENLRYLLREDEAPFTPAVNKRETGAFLDCAPMGISGDRDGRLQGVGAVRQKHDRTPGK